MYIFISNYTSINHSLLAKYRALHLISIVSLFLIYSYQKVKLTPPQSYSNLNRADFEVIQSMSQQQPKEFARGQARQSEHFRFVQKPRGAQQKTHLPQVKKKNPMIGFARWSEYVSQDSGDIEIPNSDYDSISISLSKEDNSSMTDQGNSKQGLQTSDKLQVKAEEVSAANRKEEVKEKKDQPQDAVSSYGKSYNTILKEVRNSNSSPFTIPNISEIKLKDVVNTRNSERFLLDLLSQGQERDQQQSANKGIKEQESDPLPSRQQAQTKGRKSITQKELQRRKSERVSYKQDSDPLPKHEVEPAARPRRVTINDRGKIKYPNDSISGDFSYILPQEFREVEEKGPEHHKRKLVIHEEADQDEKPVEEPMDIVKENEEEAPKAVAKEKSTAKDKADKAEKNAKMKKAEQKLKDIAKKAPVPKVSDTRKSKVVRVSERQPSRNDISRRSVSNKSISISTQPVKKVVEKRVDSQKPSKKGTVAQQEQKRRKFKKEETTEVQIIQISVHESPVDNGRPKRARQKPVKYWQNQKRLLGKNGKYAGLSKEKVLEILGFHSISDIKANPPDCTPIDIRITIMVGPRKKFYSSGINFTAMKEGSVDFNQVCIELCRPKQAKHLVAIRDDIVPIDIVQGATIEPGQTFSFENTSTAKTYYIALQLYQQSDEDEDEGQEE